MKLLHLTKIATITSLLALSNISCAAEPVKPATTAPSATYPTTQPTTTTPPRTVDHADLTTPVNYSNSKDGLLIPVDKYGKPFEQCGDEGSNNACPLYKYKTKVKEIKTTVINEIIYEINPHCIQICIDYPDNRAARCYVKCSSQLPANP